MQETIDELLYLSNLEYHNNQLPLSEEVDLVRVVNDSVETHREMAGRNKIAFELALEPVSFKGNSTLIRNLVDNLWTMQSNTTKTLVPLLSKPKIFLPKPS